MYLADRYNFTFGDRQQLVFICVVGVFSHVGYFVELLGTISYARYIVFTYEFTYVIRYNNVYCYFISYRYEGNNLVTYIMK